MAFLPERLFEPIVRPIPRPVNAAADDFPVDAGGLAP
jgi:hypothetical protein